MTMNGYIKDMCYHIQIDEERMEKIMTNESTLKKTIREEIDKVATMMVEDSGLPKDIIIKRWLQSLQRIESVCKNRNRY